MEVKNSINNRGSFVTGSLMRTPTTQLFYPAKASLDSGTKGQCQLFLAIPQVK